VVILPSVAPKCSIANRICIEPAAVPPRNEHVERRPRKGRGLDRRTDAEGVTESR
jgi:hypothetical protein